MTRCGQPFIQAIPSLLFASRIMGLPIGPVIKTRRMVCDGFSRIIDNSVRGIGFGGRESALLHQSGDIVQ